MTAIGTSYNGFASVGDPHLHREDGAHYDSMVAGKNTLLESTDSDNPFKLQTDQGAVPGYNGIFNRAVAMKVGAAGDNHVISMDVRSGKFIIDNMQTELPGLSPITLSDGTVISRTSGNAIRIATSQGDVVNITVQTMPNGQRYLDVIGELSPTRENDSVRGALGAFDDDADWQNDIYLSSGTQLTATDLNLPGWLAMFQQSWHQDAMEDDLFAQNTANSAAIKKPALIGAKR
ncbi:MAG: hypothetical protein HY692_05490 [Cyanobacteria bacterium NC_groundwater_1444_Ag_S-0.65um_54_12]|nr:hypothetical protein [Cyanobacteria bacterium NC_groundwater_1444_Ag_S-0.65um_54_12]